jgi:hypothetical protein
MLTKRLTGFAVAAALCGGCGTFTDQMTGAVNSTTQTRPAISVGQPLDEAMNLLLGAGAENITHQISTFICSPKGQPGRELLWFRLQDGKWLSVQVVEVGEPKQLVIEKLVLGDKNANHIKERGRERYPEITRLELP